MKHVMIAALLLATPALATDDDPGGELNPLESGFGRVMRNVEEGKLDMTTCATGYYITKSGRHELARKLFEACANAGYSAAMTWMSQLDNNGLGGEYNPDASADWDRRAAETGDPVGKFNYGLDLMRGHGVAQNEALGRQLVDQAAAEGLDIAQRLQGADYDLDEVTPDADNWKYAPMF
ncbi:sel1 repeat family protein [Thalassobius vesicularis]|uniref:Sel1 repeat family protein n=1 Tax=Thalassobius vesicularis TaxID=1294297 RepID=A0A4S3M570_9RHOB|nr:sel1 repeat family protein [Thalassobius vesicularis]THD71748.1 sel1 repeat family protein [Thalassobius vesicularis]